MSKELASFMENMVAIHELQAGCVGKVFSMVIRIGLSPKMWGSSEEARAWTLMYYMANYSKKPLRDAMSSPEAYDVLKARLTADKQKYL